MTPAGPWTPIVAVDRLTAGRGVRALVGGCAVAVFRLADGSLYAVGDIDPLSGASVMARGLVGSTVIDDVPTRFVASPLRKQRYALADGRSLTADQPGLGAWTVREQDGWVAVGRRVEGAGDSSTGNDHETVR